MKSASASFADPLLFTPGPLTTSAAVKQAMLHDAGSWHREFNARVGSIRERLLAIAELSRADGWEAILLQGSGTYGVEAVFATCMPPQGKVCVLSNGAYGERMVNILKHQRIPYVVLRCHENELPDPALLDETLAADPEVTHVAVVHCETTTGIINPIVALGRVSRRHGCIFVVDAMSSFGGMPIDFTEAGIDVLVASANKCLEGVPGFCFVLARRDMILSNAQHARSLSLNLADQLRGFDQNGQFRFTPPTHALLAFEQALNEFVAEGGAAARAQRYRKNHQVLVSGMRQLGFKPFLPAELQGWVITAFHCPDDSRFRFLDFYHRLCEKGFIIYPGKLTEAETFRIANLGHLFEADMRALVAAIAEVREEMGFDAARIRQHANPLECFQAVPLFLC